MTFDDLNLPDYLIRSIAEYSFKEPTAVQKEAIPIILEGADIIVESRTGTGKTAAYVLPLIIRLVHSISPEEDNHIEVLVLVPTRELAIQVSTCFNEFCKYTPSPIQTLTVIGGDSIDKQIRKSIKGPNIVIATPGRLLDLLVNEDIDISKIKTFVLDEADKLFNANFNEEFNEILEYLPKERQNLLLSATLPKKIIQVCHKNLSQAQKITITPETTKEACIKQRVFEVNRDNRRALLQHLLKTEKWDNVMVFVASKKAAFNLCQKLRKEGFSVSYLNGNLDQEDRVKVLKAFKNRKFSILVSTDIAARGIDISKLSLVVNFDLPRSPLDYIHRIGRSGRAGEEGNAISFIDHDSQTHFKLIEKRAKINLPREQVEGFELEGEALPKTKGPAPVKGKRKSKKDKLRELAKKNNSKKQGESGSIWGK